MPACFFTGFEALRLKVLSKVQENHKYNFLVTTHTVYNYLVYRNSDLSLITGGPYLGKRGLLL